MSLGNPYEFHGSLSVGLITFVGRHLSEEGVHVTNEYLQFSAPVNPGESGAPLFDMDGNVIGVTRRTLTEGRGISFAVPSRVVKELLRAVERGESQVRRGYIGMKFRAPSHPEDLRGLVSPDRLAGLAIRGQQQGVGQGLHVVLVRERGVVVGVDPDPLVLTERPAQRRVREGLLQGRAVHAPVGTEHHEDGAAAATRLAEGGLE